MTGLYLVPVDGLIGYQTTRPQGATITELVDEHTTCLAAIEYNRQHEIDGVTKAPTGVAEMRSAILATLRAVGHPQLVDLLGREMDAREAVLGGLDDAHADGLDDALASLTRARRQVAAYLERAELGACRCAIDPTDCPVTPRPAPK